MAAKARTPRFDPEAIEPIVIKKSDAPVEQIHLFSIVEDDDVREFFIPKKVKFNITLKAMEIYADRGEQAAGVYILRTVLGEENYEALVNYEDLEAEDFEKITEHAQKIVLGDREPGKRS